MSYHVTPNKSLARAANRLVYWFSRHWLLLFNLALVVFVGLPWLAPVLMHTGHETAANTIYLFYRTQCHQLPQRSFFLFGAKPSYNLTEIQAAWQMTNNPLILRQFIGNPDVGWKVAWSDRMTSMYTSILVFGLLFGLVRKRLKPLPLRGFALFLLPMFLDGTTHLVSDLAGIGQGFRDTNAWLVALTGGVFSPGFYAGDALGSFNSWMRLLTGVLFGVGTVWCIYPQMEKAFAGVAFEIQEKFARAGLKIATTKMRS